MVHVARLYPEPSSGASGLGRRVDRFDRAEIGASSATVWAAFTTPPTTTATNITITDICLGHIILLCTASGTHRDPASAVRPLRDSDST